MPFIYDTINENENEINSGGGDLSLSDIVVIKADFITGENLVIRSGELSAEEGVLYGA